MRSLIRVAVPLAALSLAVTACGGSNSGSNSANAGGNGNSGSKTLTLYSSGDVNVKSMWNDILIPGFEKANPGYHVKVVFSEHGTNDATTLAKLGASVKQNTDPGMDVIDAGLVTNAAQGGLLEPADKSKIPNLSNVDSSLLQPVNNNAVPYRGSAVVLAYNTKYVQTPPKTLDDVLNWIKANPGKFTYNSPNTGGSGHAFVETVLDKYMPADDVKKMSQTYDQSLEKDWQQGLQALKSLGPDIYQHTYPNGNQDVLNLLGKEQIYMAPVWSDMALSAKQSGLLPDSIKLEQISDPSFTGGAAYLGIPKSSRNKDAAYKFVNYVLQPDAQAQIVQKMAGFPAIDLKSMPQDVQNKFQGLDTSNLRAGYETKTANDMNQAWQQNVA